MHMCECVRLYILYTVCVYVYVYASAGVSNIHCIYFIAYCRLHFNHSC